MDALGIEPNRERIAVTTQTTLSKWDTEPGAELHRRALPAGAPIYNDLCMATQERQEAAVVQGRESDLVLVVGDTRSNNSNRLVQVVQEIARRPARLIDSAADIRPEWFHGVKRVAVTAGSSTPSHITREVIQYLESLPVEVFAEDVSPDAPSQT